MNVMLTFIYLMIKNRETSSSKFVVVLFLIWNN